MVAFLNACGRLWWTDGIRYTDTLKISKNTLRYSSSFIRTSWSPPNNGPPFLLQANLGLQEVHVALPKENVSNGEGSWGSPQPNPWPNIEETAVGHDLKRLPYLKWNIPSEKTHIARENRPYQNESRLPATGYVDFRVCRWCLLRLISHAICGASLISGALFLSPGGVPKRPKGWSFEIVVVQASCRDNQ